MIYFLVILSTITSAFASFSLKKSTGRITLLSIIKNKYLYAGGFLYVIATVFNIWLLQRLPFSVVVPLGSITYIWTMLIAYFLLKEKIGKRKIIGVVFIICGVICVSV